MGFGTTPHDSGFALVAGGIRLLLMAEITVVVMAFTGYSARLPANKLVAD